MLYDFRLYLPFKKGPECLLMDCYLWGIIIKNKININQNNHFTLNTLNYFIVSEPDSWDGHWACLMHRLIVLRTNKPSTSREHFIWYDSVRPNCWSHDDSYALRCKKFLRLLTSFVVRAISSCLAKYRNPRSLLCTWNPLAKYWNPCWNESRNLFHLFEILIWILPQVLTWISVFLWCI